MLTRSAKAKGRRLQQYVRDTILDYFAGLLEKNDVRSTSMGAQGSDIQLSPRAIDMFPWAVECKAQEGFTKLYDAYEQAKQGEGKPLVVIRSNNKIALAVLAYTDFLPLNAKPTGK